MASRLLSEDPAPSQSNPPAVATGTTRGFFYPLESLRGLAALTVVIYHAVWTNPITALRFFQNGALMVDFFFVLSGFVIFHSYGRWLNAFKDTEKFLWLRLGRLYPLHFTFLLVFLAIEVAKYVAQVRWGIVADKPAFTVNSGFAFFTNLLLIHSLGIHDSLTYNYPSWSISTEFYAYVLFALVRCAFTALRDFVIAAAAIVVICAVLLLRLHMVPIVEAGVNFGFLRCCMGFFLGALTYCAYSAAAAHVGMLSGKSLGRRLPMSGWVLLAAVVFLALLNPESVWTYLIAPVAALVILATALWPGAFTNALLCSRPLRWLGRVSYSLYMVHAALVWTITQVLIFVLKYPKITTSDGHGVLMPSGAGALTLAVYVLMVLGLSHFTYHWIEEPFRERSRALAARWFASPAARPSAI